MKSFVGIEANSDFSIYNLPYCVFSTHQHVCKTLSFQNFGILGINLNILFSLKNELVLELEN